MKTPDKLLADRTRGGFRELQKQGQHERTQGDAILENPEHPIWDVWEQIKAFYPSNTANWDAEPPIIWAKTLENLTLEQLGNGVLNLSHHKEANGNNSFPPNAGQFRDLCMMSFGWERQCHKVFTPENKLENLTSKEANQEAASDFFKKHKVTA